MLEGYIGVDFVGETLNSVCAFLKDCKEKGYKRYVNFNGKNLTSDMTELEMYTEVCGMSKEDLERERAVTLREFQKHEEHRVKEMPKVIDKYKQEGRKIFTESQINIWDAMVEHSIRDGIYDGLDLDCIIAISEVMGDEEKGKDLVQSQMHSGASGKLVMAELYKLYPQFKEYIESIFA